MKRLSLAFAIAVFVLQSCETAKEANSGTVDVNAGAGSAKIMGSDSWTDPLGGQVNIEAKLVNLNQRSSLGIGIGYSFQGSGYEEDTFSGKVKLSYLNVPLLYKYRAKSGFYAEAGLQPGYLLSAKDEYDDISEDYKYAMNKFELGLPVGAGYRTSGGFGIGARIVPGLTSNHKESSEHNLLMMVLLSYQVRKGK